MLVKTFHECSRLLDRNNCRRKESLSLEGHGGRECGSQKADWEDACRSEPLPFRLSQRFSVLSALPSSKLTCRINPVVPWRQLVHTFPLLSLHTAGVRAPMLFSFTQKKVYYMRCSQSFKFTPRRKYCSYGCTKVVRVNI